MLAASLKSLASLVAQGRAADVAIGGLGLSAALVSASFAGYMIFIGPHDGVRSDRAPITVLAGARHGPVLYGGPLPTAEAPDSFDFTPIGTVASNPSRKAAAGDAPVALADFAVRDVFDGTALVETRGALQLVRVGGTVDGVGEVLAIERQGGAWMVRTVTGVIRQRR